MLLAVIVAAIATISVEARGIQPQEKQQQQQNQDLQPGADSVDWRPHLPTSFRTGFSKPIEHGHMSEESPISEVVSVTPVKSVKKKAYIQKTLAKKSSQQHHSRSKRFLPPKQKWRAVGVPVSVFNFLGFLPVRIPGLPFHKDLPSPEYQTYRTTHEMPLRRRKWRGWFKKY